MVNSKFIGVMNIISIVGVMKQAKIDAVEVSVRLPKPIKIGPLTVIGVIIRHEVKPYK